MSKYFLCDIDGTVALRIPKEKGGRGPYDWNRVEEDLPNPPVIKVVESLIHHGFQVVFISSRDSLCQAETRRWIFQHLPAAASRTEDIRLFMRPHRDNRLDALVKAELYFTRIKPSYGEPLCVFDDRNQVVDLWRSLGFTCLQVAKGDF